MSTDSTLKPDTAQDTSTVVYLADDLRIAVGKPSRSDEYLRISVETRTLDRLGAAQWNAGGEVSRRQVEDLAAHVFEQCGLVRHHGMSWACIAGPFFGYRVLMRPASWIARLVGRRYEFCVERNYGSGPALWQDAEPSYTASEARVAWFLKQELFQHDLRAERIPAPAREEPVTPVAQVNVKNLPGVGRPRTHLPVKLGV